MSPSEDLTWWRLEFSFSQELEESLFWKFADLGIQRLPVKYSPENPTDGTLMAWFPAIEWTKADRDSFSLSLRPLADTFQLSLGSPVWTNVQDEDWSQGWKKHWHPDPVGEKLLIPSLVRSA